MQHPKYFITCVVLVILVAGASFMTGMVQRSEFDTTDAYYLNQLSALREGLIELESAADEVEALEQFRSSRLAYKKIEFLVEYYNPFEAKLLNGADLLRVEESNPGDTILPKGFQVIESHLFGGHYNAAFVSEHVGFMLNTVERLYSEPDRKLRYTKATVFDAVRMQLFRIATLGIGGFDSPVLNYSFPEAAASLKGLSDIILLNLEKLESKLEADSLIKLLHLAQEFTAEETSFESKLEADSLIKLLHLAQEFTAEETSFEQFDQLELLRTYLIPASTMLVKATKANGIRFPGGRRPLREYASNLFDIESFDLDYFSPNQRYRATEERISLGRKLFSDPLLSSNGKRSCSSCHQPERAFTDGLRLPRDLGDNMDLARNTPTLYNSAYQTRQFYDMRTSTLENQLADVVHNSSEMGGSMIRASTALKRDSIYIRLFRNAYPNEAEPVNQYTIANSISSYVRSLSGFNSRFDRYMRGELQAISKAEKAGFNLFMGKGKCGTCHFIPFFNGLVPPNFTETESEVLGVPAFATSNRKLDPDPGREGFTHIALHKHAFKTSSLRNITLTAPYMHNGVFRTLDEVLEFYNVGGGSAFNIAPGNQTLPGDSLHLTNRECRQIISFLHSLTDLPEIKKARKAGPVD